MGGDESENKRKREREKNMAAVGPIRGPTVSVSGLSCGWFWGNIVKREQHCQIWIFSESEHEVTGCTVNTSKKGDNKSFALYRLTLKTVPM